MNPGRGNRIPLKNLPDRKNYVIINVKFTDSGWRAKSVERFPGKQAVIRTWLIRPANSNGQPFDKRIKMLDTIFFSIIFFILDHIYLLLAGSLISLIAMKFCYRIWQDQLRSPDARHLSLIVLIFLIILLLIFLIGVIYLITIIIMFLPELRQVIGK